MRKSREVEPDFTPSSEEIGGIIDGLSGPTSVYHGPTREFWGMGQALTLVENSAAGEPLGKGLDGVPEDQRLFEPSDPAQ